MNEIKLLSDDVLNDWCQSGKIPDGYVLIDIREPAEYASEHIPGSINIPASKLESADLSQYEDKIAVFYCRLGNRTQNVKEKLMMFNFKEAYCLPQGIEQWKSCKMPVIKDSKAPLDIMRQVQITAGALVLVGSILGYVVTPYFYLLSAFVGAGLMFAGISGTCMMATMLSKMPWNKIN